MLSCLSQSAQEHVEALELADQPDEQQLIGVTRTSIGAKDFVVEWFGHDLGALDVRVTFRYVLWGFTALVLGVQTIYGSFFLSILLTLLGWIPGVIHAALVVNDYHEEQRIRALPR